MATLADVALICAKRLGRANAAGTAISDLEAEIKEEIGNEIKFRNRGSSHLTEFRGMELTTSAGTSWYSTVDATTGSGEQAAGSRSTMPVGDIVRLDYVRENPGASGLNEPLWRKGYVEFEQLYEGSTPQSTPTYYTIYAGQMGLWPVPDGAYTIYLSGDVKPVVPTADSDTSIWFDEAQELILAGACRRVCLNYLRDPERAAEFAATERGERNAFHREYVIKSSHRIKAHC